MKFPNIVLLLSFLPVLGPAAEPASPWQEVQEGFLQASRSEHDANIKAWTEVAGWNFNEGTLPAEFRVFEGEWKVEKGSLWAYGGKRESNRTIKIADCRWPAFRVEFDATLHPTAGEDPARICDIAIRFNADPATGRFDKGYSLITAQYGNQSTVLYRLNAPYARTEWSPILPGTRHHIVLEVVSPHIRFWVDGRVVLEAWERRGSNLRDLDDFMPMDPAKVIALGTYDTMMEIDNLCILVPAEKTGQPASKAPVSPAAVPQK